MKNIALTLLAAGVAFSAQAQEKTEAEVKNEAAPVSAETVFATKSQAVLFKIHDIKPVLNTDGAVTACEYTATFFNRTKKGIRQAKVDFGWTDRVSDLYMIENSVDDLADAPEVEEKAQAKNEAKKTQKAPETLGSILSSVDVPSLGVLKQVSIKGTAPTDKCFALFDNLKFSVKSCTLAGDEAQNHPSGANGVAVNNCVGMFTYIDSKNPEYYGEFKEIAYEELETREKTAEEQEKEQISAAVKVVDENITKTSEVVAEIK